MMIFVGIDIAKLNHFASAISSDGEILIEPFQFTNDGDGFQLLISKLDSFDKDSLIIGCPISCCFVLQSVCSQPYQDFLYAKK